MASPETLRIYDTYCNGVLMNHLRFATDFSQTVNNSRYFQLAILGQLVEVIAYLTRTVRSEIAARLMMIILLGRRRRSVEWEDSTYAASGLEKELSN